MDSITTGQLANWMMQQGLSTDHDETIEGLLRELERQLDELRDYKFMYEGLCK